MRYAPPVKIWLASPGHAGGRTGAWLMLVAAVASELVRFPLLYAALIPRSFRRAWWRQIANLNFSARSVPHLECLSSHRTASLGNLRSVTPKIFQRWPTDPYSCVRASVALQWDLHLAPTTNLTLRSISIVHLATTAGIEVQIGYRHWSTSRTASAPRRPVWVMASNCHIEDRPLGTTLGAVRSLGSTAERMRNDLAQ